VAIIYAASTGELDTVPTPRVRDFEQGFYRYLELERPEILTRIAETKALDDETAAALKAAVAAFRESFLA
jgi:F-type H+-transporting ATPase subunit alpha